MVGGSASVVRATIMGILLLWANSSGAGPTQRPNAPVCVWPCHDFVDPNTLFRCGLSVEFHGHAGMTFGLLALGAGLLSIPLDRFFPI